MWSLLLLMVDETAFTRLEGIGTRELLRLSRAWALVLLALQPLAALSPVVEAAGTWFSALRWLVWVLYGPFALWMFLRIAGGPVTRRPNASWAWLFPVMVVVNGLMPILGLKNRNSWQMYANLRLEADHSNHFLLPPSLDVAGYLADHVAVQQVSDPELHERWVRPGHRETWFMFRTELARHPDLSVRYERNGKVVTVERVGDHPELSQPYPLPIRAWVWFRPLGPEVGRTCMW